MEDRKIKEELKKAWWTAGFSTDWDLIHLKDCDKISY